MNNYTIEHLINLQQVQGLLEAHVTISGIACGLMDNDGNIIIGAGLQQVCTQFLWEHPASFDRCWRNDPTIKQELHAFSGDLFECCCQNGMINIAMPIIIEGNRLAVFFSGQFFYEDAPPDLTWFQAQAEELGFDPETYLAAVCQAPLLNRNHVANTMRFLHQVVQLLAETGYTNLRRLREEEERKQTEQQLNLLNFALDHVREAVFLKDLKAGRFMYVNQEACRSLEYGRDELISMSALDIDPDFSPESLQDNIANLLKHGTVTFESRHRARSGRIFPVEISSTLFTYGGTQYAFALVRNTAQRKQTEQQLKLFNFAFEHVREGAFLIELNKGTFIQVNQEACRSLEYSRDELTGMSALDIDPNFSPELLHDNIAELLQKGTMTFETLHRSKSGRIFPVELTATIFEFDGVRYSLSLVRNISDRKQSEEALRESEERFRLLVEQTPDLIFIRHKEQILYANPAAVRITGATCIEELIGRSVLDFARPERREYLAALLSANDTTPVGTVMPPFEGSLVRLDGATVPIELTAIRFRYRGMECSQQIMRDITERKRSEQMLLARLRILERTNQPAISLQDSLRLMLDEIESLTGSSIAFYHFLDADQQTLSLQGWSTATLATICKAEGAGSHYPVAQAGVWADAVRERKPVIHNNYAALPGRKGMPEGHAAVIRELVVPIFRREQIVAIIGVGNKPTDYAEADLQVVALLGDLSWEIVTRKKAEAQLRESEEQFRTLAENAPDIIVRYDTVCCPVYVNTQHLKAIGRPVTEILGKSPMERFPDGEFREYQAALEEVIKTGRHIEIEHVLPATTALPGCYQTHLVAERNSDGVITGVLAIGRNITERKRIEQKLYEKQQKLTEMALKLSLAEERERRRIATELHDHLSQSLLLGKIKLRTLIGSHAIANDQNMLEEMLALQDQMIRSVRSLTQQLSPPILAVAGLVDALKWLGERMLEDLLTIRSRSCLLMICAPLCFRLVANCLSMLPNMRVPEQRESSLAGRMRSSISWLKIREQVLTLTDQPLELPGTGGLDYSASGSESTTLGGVWLSRQLRDREQGLPCGWRLRRKEKSKAPPPTPLLNNRRGSLKPPRFPP